MTKPPAKPPKPHTRSDHALGALFDHHHSGDADHDHDHDHNHSHETDSHLAPGESRGVILTTIGIDVGSSGTQVAFARLHLEGEASPYQAPTERVAIRQRETIFQSAIYLTPFLDAQRIDEVRLLEIVDQAFAGAGLTPDDIDSGVVIMTGAARDRTNAAVITARLAERCGDIVSASAGHHMEARLAAHGSGAVARSLSTGKRFLNIDIGGATTKLAVCEGGRILATAALDIGGRLVATTAGDRIVRLEAAGAAHARRAGFDWSPNGIAPASERGAVGRRMADDLVAAVISPTPPEHVVALYLTAPLPGPPRYDGVIVSGGVGEYVNGRETRSFGDLGLPLGRAIAARIDAGALPWPLMPATECIRATVLGASACSVQLSGRTGCISNAARLLPRRNLPVLRPILPLCEIIDPGAVAAAIRAHLAEFESEATSDLALAIRWTGAPEYPRLRALADGIAAALSARLATALPLHLIVDADIAGSLGAILIGEVGITSDVLVLDGIALDDFDYVDLGRIRLPSETVPVTIKTLVFREQSGHSPGKRTSPRRRKPAR